MLSFQGNQIVGKKGFAVVEKNVIYWYERKSKNFQDLIT